MGAHATGLRPTFRVRSDRRNGVARVALQGELDLATVPELDEHLALLEEDGARALMLDLRNLAFIDCTGLRALLRAFAHSRDNNHRIAIVGASGAARRLFQLTGTQGILDEPEGLMLLERFTQGNGGPRPSSGAYRG